MKQLIFIALIALVSCGPNSSSSPDGKITYDITYIDGTKETVTLHNEISFEQGGNCIATCGCGGEDFKRCGVRKFDKITTPVVVKAPVKPAAKTATVTPITARGAIVKKPKAFKN